MMWYYVKYYRAPAHQLVESWLRVPTPRPLAGQTRVGVFEQSAEAFRMSVAAGCCQVQQRHVRFRSFSARLRHRLDALDSRVTARARRGRSRSQNFCDKRRKGQHREDHADAFCTRLPGAQSSPHISVPPRPFHPTPPHANHHPTLHCK